MIRLLPLVALTGCPWIGPDLHDANVDPDPDTGAEVPYVLNSVDPTFSPTGVAVDVDILGEGFEPDRIDDYQVLFGGRQVPIMDMTETRITVTTPELNEARAYDISVVDGDGEQDLPEAFTAYVNRYNPNAPASAEPHGTGALGLLQWFEHVSADWAPTPPDSASASIAFTTGAEVILPVELFAPGLGQCTTTRPTPSATFIPLEDASVVLESDLGAAIELQPNATNTGYRNDAVPVSQIDGEFALLPVASTELNPSFGVSPIFEMPPALPLLGPQLGGGSVSQNGFYVEWDPSGPADAGDFVVVRAEMYDSDFTTLLETVWCAAAFDASNLRVTPTAWQEWSDGNAIRLYAGQARHIPHIFDYNLSKSSATAVHWSVGPLRAGQ